MKNKYNLFINSLIFCLLLLSLFIVSQPDKVNIFNNIKPSISEPSKKFTGVATKSDILTGTPIYISNLSELPLYRKYPDVKSDVRFLLFSDYIKQFNLRDLLFGKGFGIGFSFRVLHFENFYLEILYKGGLIGLTILFFFLYPTVKFFLNFIFFRQKGTMINTRLPLFFSCLSILVLSLFNPYFLNNFGLLLYSTFLIYEKKYS